MKQVTSPGLGSVRREERERLEAERQLKWTLAHLGQKPKLAQPITAARDEATAISATFDATFSISADAPAISAAPAGAPNPAAKLDMADATSPDKTKIPPGANPNSTGTMKPDKNGDPPRPRFTMTAYNGGPMKLNGYQFPVIVDGCGVKAAAKHLPIYVGHDKPYDDEETRMEKLLGQTDEKKGFSVDKETGEISCGGIVTGESPLCQQAMTHARNGFKFQASINAQPQILEFVQAGTRTKVNGRMVSGPVVVARAATCDHIALVPLGADTSTTAQIAAEAAKGRVMEFAAWLTATYALDAAALTPEQKSKFEAEFGRIAASHAGAPALKTEAPKPEVSVTDFTVLRAETAKEDTRISAVRTVAKDHPEISAKAITEGWDVARTTDAVEVATLRASRAASISEGSPAIISAGMPKDGLSLQAVPCSRGGRQIAASGRISNDMAAVIETCGLISAGYSADRLAKNPAYGPRTVEMADQTMQRFGSGLGPMGLMRLAASFAHVSLPHSNDDAYKAIVAEFSTLSLPTILSNLMNKFLLDSYNAVDPDWLEAPNSGTTAWQKFTKRGPVQDFKPHYRVRLTGDMEFKDLGPSGEIQHGKISEQSYMVQASTKAIMFAITRQDIINDDLSAMSTLPTLFGRGAGVRIAKFIYGLLIAGLQSDRSTAFFSSTAITTAGNLMQPNLIASSPLSFVTLEAAEAAFMAQTDPTGQPAGVMPEVLLVPPGLLNLARQLWQSEMLIPSVTTTGGTAATLRGVPAKNTLAGRFRPVCSQWLASLTAAQINDVIKGLGTSNAGSNSTWYLAAGPQQAAYPIEAGFLNGSEMPIVERDEMQFDRLGVAFRGFIDFGANLAEPRSIVKCTA
jgi:hypothetical protein